MNTTRRNFLRNSGMAAGAGLFWLYGCAPSGDKSAEKTAEAADTTAALAGATAPLFFKISLAQWSLHKTLFDKKMDNLDFAAKARSFGCDGIEYVNQFFMDKAKDAAYLAEMNKRAADAGVQQVLIMCDGEGGLAETDAKERNKAVENHYKWVEAAKTLGCHSIRVNAFSKHKDPAEAAKAAVEGLSKLGEYGKQAGINVIVENHGGFSSNGEWLSGVMRTINMPNVGTLPDFGNFCVKRDGKGEWDGKCIEEYDRYKGIAEMMPFAKGVSAKSNEFNEKGDCIETDYVKMLKVVKDAGYKGFIGIEYEGPTLSEEEGIKATKALMERVGASLG